MNLAIAADTLIADIMRARPETIRVLMRHNMLCIGCPIAAFHTVGDICEIYRLDLPLFLDEIRSEIGSGGFRR